MSQIIPVQNPSLVTYTHVIYALHLISVLIGVTGAVTSVGSFIFGVPSIVALVIFFFSSSSHSHQFKLTPLWCF
jgi:hypothetical protein